MALTEAPRPERSGTPGQIVHVKIPAGDPARGDRLGLRSFARGIRSDP